MGSWTGDNEIEKQSKQFNVQDSFIIILAHSIKEIPVAMPSYLISGVSRGMGVSPPPPPPLTPQQSTDLTPINPVRVPEAALLRRVKHRLRLRTQQRGHTEEGQRGDWRPQEHPSARGRPGRPCFHQGSSPPPPLQSGTGKEKSAYLNWKLMAIQASVAMVERITGGSLDYLIANGAIMSSYSAFRKYAQL